MGGKRVVDSSGMLKTLKDNPNYKSEAAKKAIEITEKMNKIHGLDHTLADAFKAPKDPKLQQGLSHNVAVRYLTMAANRAVQNTVKFLPFLQMGKTAASRHAIYNAVMSSSSARELGEKLSKAAMNKDIPISEKIDIIEMAKAQFKFSNELDKAKADGIVKETAEQGSKLEQAEAKQEVVKGEGWTMKEGKLTYLDQVKFELDDWLKAQTGIDDVITASLAWLKSEHPEMHNSKRAVKELIEYVLDRPSVVKSGKSENSVYLGKADDSKMKDIVIDKGDKKIIHANRRKMTSEEKEAKRASEDALHSHTDTKPAGALTLGQDARLARFNDSIISQNSAKDETAIKTHANPHVGAGLAGGTLNAKDENGNFDAEKFAKGFIYGLFGSKVTAATLKKTNPKLYDQIVNIGKDKAGKEKISSFVNKLKQDELGKLLQKTITNKDLSAKTKIEIIEAAKKRFTKETPKSLNGQSEAQMSESALKAKENNLKIDDVSNDAKEKWIKTFGLKSIDDDFIPNLKPEVKKAIKNKEIRLTKGSLLKIVARGREKYIPLIKQSLEDTDMVLKDEGTFLFVKEMDDNSLVFTSVGRNFDTHITIISNAPKKINNIKNKMLNGVKVVYRSSKLRTTPL